MKKTNICQHMLDLIEKEKNLQLKVYYLQIYNQKSFYLLLLLH